MTMACTLCYEDVADWILASVAHRNDGEVCDGVCSECWKHHLTAQVDSRHPDAITCPQCDGKLEEPVIERFATIEAYAS